MTEQELLTHVTRGRILVVGEYRGSHAEAMEYVDSKSGNVIRYIRGIHLLESQVQGNLDRIMIYERLPEVVETVDEAMFPYERGKRYVVFLSSIKRDHGQWIGQLGERGMVPLESEEKRIEGGLPAALAAGARP